VWFLSKKSTTRANTRHSAAFGDNSLHSSTMLRDEARWGAWACRAEDEDTPAGSLAQKLFALPQEGGWARKWRVQVRIARAAAERVRELRDVDAARRDTDLTFFIDAHRAELEAVACGPDQ